RRHHRRGDDDGGGTSSRVRELQQPIPLRGEPAGVRAQGGRRANDAGGAPGKARRAQDSARVATSTSPGGLRSSQATSLAGSDFAPSLGTSLQIARVSRTGWRRTPPYLAAT